LAYITDSEGLDDLSPAEVGFAVGSIRSLLLAKYLISDD